jgi:hypothetical protein
MLLPAGAGAQIVNIERILAGEPQPGVQGALQFSYGLREGNSESQRLESNGLIRWRGGPTIVQLALGGSYQTAGENKVAENALGHIRYGYLIGAGTRLEALLQVQQNQIVRLRRRVLIGAGARVRLMTINRGAESEAGAGRLDLGLVTMFEEEELRSGESNTAWRASLLLNAGVTLSETVVFGSQVYFQPVLDDPRDFRLLNDLGLTVRLLGPLSTQIDLRVVHDSRPPAAVKRTDVVLRNTLAISF